MAPVKLTTLIVDDEPLARRRLRRLLRDHPSISLIGECDSAASALATIEAAPVDLVLLDVQMPGQSGLDLLEAIPAVRRPAVIFVTAHDAYAVAAFNARAADYVLKPVQPERLREAIRRVVERLETVQPSMEKRAPWARRIPVAQGPRLVPVAVAEIDWIQSAGNYVHLHLGPRTLVHRSPLSELERSLDPEQFVRIHRSVIVNAERVAHLTPLVTGDYQVELVSGVRLRLSRTRRFALDLLLTGRDSRAGR